MPVQPRIAPAPSAVVSKAVVRAAGLLGLSQKDLAGILKMSPAQVSRLFNGKFALEPSSAEGERALMLIRIFRSLDTLVGGDPAKARAWLFEENKHLESKPVQRLANLEGMVRVAEYLDAMRGAL